MRQLTFAREAAGPRPRASEQLCPLNPPRSPSGRRLARHPSSNQLGVAECRESASVEPCLPRSAACLLVLHCSRPSRLLKPPNRQGGWRSGSTPTVPHSHLAHVAKGPFCMEEARPLLRSNGRSSHIVMKVASSGTHSHGSSRLRRRAGTEERWWNYFGFPSRYHQAGPPGCFQ